MSIAKPKTSSRISGSISGTSGVYFVSGELARLGYIALPTIRNTKGIDMIVTDPTSSRTVYLQVKTNRIEYDFWIVGKPEVADNLYYVFVNLLGDSLKRPDYFVVPSKDVQNKYQQFSNAKDYANMTAQERDQIVKALKDRRSAWQIVEESGISVKAIREVARQNGIKIKYDRGKGEDFPFCFSIKADRSSRYRDKWEQLFP